MAYQTKMLFRTSLQDIGDMSGHGSYCSSPDMIVHSLVKNPQSEFGTNYDKDPNEKVDVSSRTNTIYTRVKSMQESSGATTGYIRLYRASMSLFMNTDQWKDNKLRTPDGKEYVIVTSTENGEIAVGDGVLVVDGTKPHFCMVGIVNDSEQETLPNRFSSYDDFVMRVHSERCVAVRNFSLQNSGQKYDYESLYYFTNPESRARLGTILVEASGLPKRTVFGLVNKDIGMDKWTEFDPDNPAKRQVTDSAFLEEGFNGYVKIYARLPQGQVWPVSASLVTTFWISADEKEKMLQFARPVHQVLLNRSAFESLDRSNGNGRLVKVGFCETLYI